jgi:AcrR family transcriptional regulator
MVRWQPNAQERLGEAALRLYASRGFEATTVAEIADSVGLTERTFFRHFADKREVIFSGQERFQQVFVNGIASASADATPLAAVIAAVTAASEFFSDERLTHSRLRQTVIAAHPELHERELLKMATLSTALTAALVEHGIPESAATLAANYGVMAFQLSFERWLLAGDTRSFADIARDVFAELGALTAS